MATIARRQALPKLPSTPTCPAALVVAGASADRSGVVCGVFANQRQRELGLDMTPAQLEVKRESDGGAFLSLVQDPSGVEHLCCGDAVPVLHDAEVPGNRASYTYCPVWQAEKMRIAAGADQLTEENIPDRVSYGIADQDEQGHPVGTTLSDANPWAAARRGMDTLVEGE